MTIGLILITSIINFIFVLTGYFLGVAITSKEEETVQRPLFGFTKKYDEEEAFVPGDE